MTPFELCTYWRNTQLFKEKYRMAAKANKKKSGSLPTKQALKKVGEVNTSAKSMPQGKSSKKSK